MAITIRDRSRVIYTSRYINYQQPQSVSSQEPHSMNNATAFRENVIFHEITEIRGGHRKSYSRVMPYDRPVACSQFNQRT
jgi:hypothetical protein